MCKGNQARSPARRAAHQVELVMNLFNNGLRVESDLG
jgi:hypothetical protein